jgi:hypothetical protein
VLIFVSFLISVPKKRLRHCAIHISVSDFARDVPQTRGDGLEVATSLAIIVDGTSVLEDGR